MRKTVSIILACLLTGLLLIGCGVKNNNKNATENNDNKTVNIISVNAKELLKPEYDENNTVPSAVANGANDFAFRLSASLVNKSGNENFVCSPYSVWIPLAALLNATDDKYKADLLTALGAAGITEADVNNAASRMLYDLTMQRDKDFSKDYKKESGEEYPYNDPLKIANAIFVGNNVTLKKEFAQVFMDFYRGSAMEVDFKSKEAVDTVNKWASENTEGLIDEIIQEFDPDTVAAIANAIYFSDRWSREFKPEQTKEDIFYSQAGETKAFYMLREGDDQTYYEDGKVQAMPLRFQTGGGLYIILPKDGDANGLLASMTNEYFDEIQRDSVSATGKLLLPRFSIESGIMSLKDTLTGMGVPLFDKNAAPLTNGLIEESIPVWLSSAAQKAVIKVDEKGTTAAAVTVMTAAGTSMPLPTEPFEMICNKPFVFVLYGNTSDGGSQVLFTGVVNRP